MIIYNDKVVFCTLFYYNEVCDIVVIHSISVFYGPTITIVGTIECGHSGFAISTLCYFLGICI